MLMVVAEVKKLILSKLSQQIYCVKQHSQQKRIEPLQQQSMQQLQQSCNRAATEAPLYKLIEPLQQSMQQLQQSCNRGSSLQAHCAAVHLNVLVNNAYIFNE